jgi:lipoyl(octanoyl) transferase
MQIAVENVFTGAEEVIFITEHPGIYTAGKSFEQSDFLNKSSDFRIYYPNRGGRITIHSPGQIVIYPIINLKERRIGVIDYVRELENWIIRILDAFAVHSFKISDEIGIWTSAGKIGFIGVRIEKGISSHGFCININNELRSFENILPCGLINAKITSLSEILGREIQTQDLSEIIIKHCPF